MRFGNFALEMPLEAINGLQELAWQECSAKWDSGGSAFEVLEFNENTRKDWAKSYLYDLFIWP